MKIFNHDIITKLNENYRKFSDKDERYLEYENEMDWGKKAEMAADFLRNGHVMLTSDLELGPIHKNITGLLKGKNLVLKIDWSITITLIQQFKTNDSNLIDSFNIVVQRLKSNGTMEKMVKEWFQVDFFKNGKDRDGGQSLGSFDQAKSFVFILAGTGSSLALVVCAYQLLQDRRMKNSKVAGGVGLCRIR